MMRYLTGYILIPDKRSSAGYRKIAFRAATGEKEKARKQLKDQFPGGRIHFVKEQTKGIVVTIGG